VFALVVVDRVVRAEACALQMTTTRLLLRFESSRIVPFNPSGRKRSSEMIESSFQSGGEAHGENRGHQTDSESNFHRVYDRKNSPVTSTSNSFVNLLGFLKNTTSPALDTWLLTRSFAKSFRRVKKVANDQHR
jgi:hypothetical protein